MKDDYDFESELANSIANIVDEEIEEANVYVKKTSYAEPISEPTKTEKDSKQDKNPDQKKNSEKKTIIIIISIVVGAILLIGLIAFIVLSTLINKSKDNFEYYYNQGYEARENEDYESAIEDFEKAYTYEEGQTDILTMLYMYECYDELEEYDQAEEILNSVLDIEYDNFNALYYLVKLYEENEEYDKIVLLYDSIRDVDNDKIVGLFSEYEPIEPVLSPDGGDYNGDQKIGFSIKSGAFVYYTLDGTDPTVYSTLYEEPFTITEGDTTLKYITENEYGILSEVFKEEYSITYSAPDRATISPVSGQYTTASEQLVVIGNIPEGGKAYYTIDGSTPTTSSTLYSAPFSMPSGSSVVSVLIMDKNGLLSDIATAVYKLEIVDKYTDADAVDFIWDALEAKEVVDEDHLNEDGETCTIGYYSKQTIDGKSIWMYTISFKSVKEDYWYGVDADDGDVYRIISEDGDYIMTHIVY